MQRIITTTAALAATGLAVALAVSSAAGRAPSPHAVVLLAALSASVVLATHSRTGLQFNGNHYELAAALYY